MSRGFMSVADVTGGGGCVIHRKERFMCALCCKFLLFMVCM